MIRHYLRLLAVPLLLFAVFTALNFTWAVFSLPAPAELAILVKDWFNTYGLPIVFLCSIIEGALILGSYFPGVFVIFIGVILADTPEQAAVSVLVASTGLFVAHVINYFLGKYGWHALLTKFGFREAVRNAEVKLKDKGPLVIFSTYWLPSLGALTDTAAGIIGLPFKTFLVSSVLSMAFWNTLVAVVVYFLGDRALAIAAPGSGRSTLVYIVLALWMILLVYADYAERKANRINQE